MKVAVWDTYVTKADGKIMHFDILTPDHLNDKEQIYAYGKQYLATKGQENSTLTAKECRFCHVDQAPAEIEAAIEANGYYIIEMEGCQN